MADTASGPYRFPATEWPLVDEAAGESGISRQRLQLLLVRYLPPLRAHLVFNKRIPADRADDLLQGFVADQILQHRLLSQASREKGKFRTLLLTALDRHIITQLRHDTAQKRRCPQDTGDAHLPPEPSEQPHPDTFDIAWARQVLTEAVNRMRHECESSRRPDLWGIFEDRILNPAFHDTPPVPYEQLVQRFGFLSPAQASNALITARRMFIRILRGIVGEYIDDQKQIDAEIADLREFLSGAVS